MGCYEWKGGNFMSDIEYIDTVIKGKAKKWEEKTIALRHYLHEHPEVSGEEYETSKFLKEKVKQIGLKITEIDDSTGFVAILDTGKPGRTLGIRTDIDALPIEEPEDNLSQKRVCISKNKGVMHACGHDGHMAILLTAMHVLWEMRQELKGKIYFIFEEGEETNSGIEKMVHYLRDKEIDGFYGNHLVSFMDTGEICIDAGPRMAGAIPAGFTVHGKSGHGSRPDLSVNPIFAAAQILSGLTNAWANQIDVTKTVTLGITQIHGGSTYNVIPDKVMVDGSLRFFDRKEGEKAKDIFKKVIRLTAEAHNCQVEFPEPFGISLYPVVNDSQLAAQAKNSIQSILPGALRENITWMASETFHYYSELAPILFAFIGTRNEQYGSGAEHHNNQFDVDDSSLLYGVICMTKFAYSFLNESFE